MLPFPRGRAQHPRGPSAQTALWLPPHCPPSSASLLRIPSFLPEVPPKTFLPLINDVYTNTESFFSFRLCKFRGGAQRSPTEHRVWAQFCCCGSATMPVPVLLHPKVSPGCTQSIPKLSPSCPAWRACCFGTSEHQKPPLQWSGTGITAAHRCEPGRVRGSCGRGVGRACWLWARLCSCASLLAAARFAPKLHPLFCAVWHSYLNTKGRDEVSSAFIADFISFVAWDLASRVLGAGKRSAASPNRRAAR